MRKLLAHIHPEGESQKIQSILQTFTEVYIRQNPELIEETFHDPETIGVLAYSILMLHTAFYNKSVRRNSKPMTQQEFIHNNRGIDDGHDLPPLYLRDIYNRVAEEEFKTLPDHTDKLRDIHGLFTGPLKSDNFLERHRRFIAWFAAYDVGLDLTPQRSIIRPLKLSRRTTSSLRGLFLFNDVLVVTKPIGGLRSNAVDELRGEPRPLSISGGFLRAKRRLLSMDRLFGRRSTGPARTKQSENYPSSFSVTLTGTYSATAPLTSGQILRLESESGCPLQGACSTDLPVDSFFCIEQVIPLENLHFTLFKSECKFIWSNLHCWKFMRSFVKIHVTSLFFRLHVRCAVA